MSTPKPLTRQGRVNRDPTKIRKIYPLEDITLGQNIMLSLAQFRLLTNQQIGELLFRQTLTPTGTMRSDKKFQRAANESLDRLINLGMVTRCGVWLQHRTSRNKYMTHLNLLTSAGAREVQGWYNDAGAGQAVRWASSLRSKYHQTQPNHLVAVNDALIHLTRAVWSMGGDVITAMDDGMLKSFFTGFCPDFLMVVQMPSGKVAPLFGEVDRGSMTETSSSLTVRDWTKKIQSYGSFFVGQYREHQLFFDLGYDPRDMAHPLVLILTAKDGRLRNLRAATHKAGGGNAYWHTTLSAIYDDPKRGVDNWLSMQEPIWLRPTGDELVSLADHFDR